MKATHYFLALGFLLVMEEDRLFCQVINQDADGNSTIYMEGGNIGLDINKTEAAVTYNKTFLGVRPNSDTGPNLMVGFAARSRNEVGLAGLFDNGKFVPGGSMSTKFGIVWNSEDENRSKQLRNVKTAVDNLKRNKEMNFDKNAILPARDVIKTQRKILEEMEKTIAYNRTLLYLEGGFRASGFNLREELGTVDTWANLYQKEIFVAPYLQLVTNFQYNGWMNGFSVGYAKANNLGALSLEKLNLTQYDTLSDGQVTRESSKDAYRKSEYKIFDKITFNYDLVKVLELPTNPNNGEKQGHVAMNILYIRYGMTNYTGQLRLGQKQNHQLNVGTGVHFFDNKGKFLGGLYVQFSDVVNWDNQTKWGSKFTFGIVTRFNVESLKTVY